MFIIEPVRREDLGQVVRLAATALKERYDPAWLAQYAGRPEGFVVARDVAQGKVVGFAVACREEPCQGHILAIAVEEAYRGVGIGSALLSRVGREMQRMGAYALELDVRSDDPVAWSFYQRHGFHPEGLRPRVYSDGSDALRLSRPI